MNKTVTWTFNGTPRQGCEEQTPESSLQERVPGSSPTGIECRTLRRLRETTLEVGNNVSSRVPLGQRRDRGRSRQSLERVDTTPDDPLWTDPVVLSERSLTGCRPEFPRVRIEITKNDVTPFFRVDMSLDDSLCVGRLSYYGPSDLWGCRLRFLR